MKSALFDKATAIIMTLLPTNIPAASHEALQSNPKSYGKLFKLVKIRFFHYPWVFYYSTKFHIEFQRFMNNFHKSISLKFIICFIDFL